MKQIPLITFFILVWFMSWRGFASSDLFLEHGKGYWVSGELGLLVSILVLLYLAQAMIISFFIEKLAGLLFYKIYSLLFVPISTVFYNSILLKAVGSGGLVEFYYFMFEGFIIVFFYKNIQYYFGEEVLPRLNPRGQIFWTSILPPSRLSDMYRGFILLIVMFFLPFIMASRYF